MPGPWNIQTRVAGGAQQPLPSWPVCTITAKYLCSGCVRWVFWNAARTSHINWDRVRLASFIKIKTHSLNMERKECVAAFTCVIAEIRCHVDMFILLCFLLKSFLIAHCKHFQASFAWCDLLASCLIESLWSGGGLEFPPGSRCGVNFCGLRLMANFRVVKVGSSEAGIYLD